MTVFKTLGAATTAFLIAAGAAQAATIVETSATGFGTVPSGDLAGVTRTLTVSESLTITDLELSLRLETTWIGDVVMSLVSPEGTTVDVLCRVGRSACSSGAGFGDSSNTAFGRYTFDDEAGASFAATALALGTNGVIPANTYSTANPTARGGGLLSSFDGEDAMGVWSLTVADAAFADRVRAGQFTLIIDGDLAAVPLPATLPMLVAALGGAAVLRRKRKA